MPPFVLFLVCSSAAAGAVCTAGAVVGCYVDGGDVHRILPQQVADLDDNTLENCAAACFDAGFTAPDAVFGVEYGVQCFCGNHTAALSGATAAPAAECKVRQCPGELIPPSSR